jgi:hypothetical protein
MVRQNETFQRLPSGILPAIFRLAAQYPFTIVIVIIIVIDEKKPCKENNYVVRINKISLKYMFLLKSGITQSI